jgi:murein L,D-transpeptidase YafK
MFLVALLVLSIAAGPAVSASFGGRAAPPVKISDSGPEPELLRILGEIENNRLDSALEKTEGLLRQYPNFRLAHLIKGDLLLARGMPLSTFGNVKDAPRESLSDLREEIVARLDANRGRPAADNVPRYLLQMRSDQKYAIVIDTQKARLYLYQNDLSAGGRPRFVADYYISYGKLGADKRREGDKRTPTGVYHVTSRLEPRSVGDFYGTGAFPINYPNEWDKRLGRNGHGIWLHGTPPDTFSRPPKASDGCVVLSNADLDALAKNLQIGLTPVIISNSIEWLSFDDWQSERKALNEEIEAWRSAWESRDVERYLKHYSRKFATRNQTLEQFAKQKRQVNANKAWIKVKLSNVSMFRDPGKDELVVVTFEQDYRSSNLNNQMKKRQYWIREDGNWKIVFEGAA